MKKILICVFGLIWCAGAFAAQNAAPKTYLETEQKYIFSAENVQQTILEFVDVEKLQQDMTKKYAVVMNQETGAVSVADLFAVCMAGGANTYRRDGYEYCRDNFIVKLLEYAEQEIEEGFLGGYCPGEDENGKNPNALKSITSDTHVGDFCSSSNIAWGEVVFTKEKHNQAGYACTCRAERCNNGYEYRGGACVTIVADGNGNCLRTEYNNITSLPNGVLEFCKSKSVRDCKIINGIKNYNGQKGKVVCNATEDEFSMAKARTSFCKAMSFDLTKDNNTFEKCKSFCQKQCMSKKCKYKTVLIQHSLGKCVCNPDSEDMAESNLYKEVCGKDKGKTGKKEYCETDFFNWTQTGIRQAVGFAQEYAKIKHNNTIYCVEKTRTSGNDDYLKCATKDQKTYYEFKFDDVKESNDQNRRMTERSALCRLSGGTVKKGDKVAANMNLGFGDETIYQECKLDQKDCINKLKPLAQRYGHDVEYEYKNDKCLFTAFKNIKTTQEFVNGLATIEGLDNYYLFSKGEIQARANANLIRALRQYVNQQLSNVDSFNCDPGYKTIKQADKFMHRIVGDHDDVMRCYVNKKPIDFVFDDLSEGKKETREAGDSAIACKQRGGTLAREKCHGMSQQQCTDLDKQLKNKNPKSSGTWFVNNDCYLADASEKKAIDDVVQAGLTAVSLVDCAVGTHFGCVLATVEVVGYQVEQSTGEAMQQRADEFIKIALACDNRNCAIKTLKDMAAKVTNVQDALSSPSTVDAIDGQLARLVGYLEPEDLQSEVSANDWGDIVRQLGGDPNDTAGSALKIANKIGFFAQFASLGASALRLTGKAIAKVAAKSAAKTAVQGTRVATKTAVMGTKIAKTAGHADDAARAAAKLARRTDDAARAFAKTASYADDAAKAADNAADAARGASTGAKAAGNTSDAARGATKVEHVSDATKTADKGTDAARGTGKADDVGDATKALGMADDASDFAKAAGAADGADDAARITELRKTARKEPKLKNLVDDIDIGKVKTVADALNPVDKTAPDVKIPDEPKSGIVDDGLSAVRETGNVARNAIPEHFSPEAKKIIKDIDEVSKTRAYAVVDDIQLTGEENKYITELVQGRQNLGSVYWEQPNGSGGILGTKRFVIQKTDDMFEEGGKLFRRINTKPINNLQGKSITTIKGKSVFLEPLDNGGLIGNVSGRPVVVVNYDGHKIPFYASSGEAGKLDVPTGKWEAFFGFSPENGWFNKGSLKDIVGHYDSPELKNIAQALDRQIGDQRNIENVYASISRDSWGGKGIVASYDGPGVSKESINRMLDFKPVNRGDSWKMWRNIESVKGYFK